MISSPNTFLKQTSRAMLASTLQTDSQASRRAISRSLGYDFALLGLNAREARVDVIRDASSKTASRIHDAAIDLEDQASMLADLAISTYRLLDPRRRERMMERVQLCILSECDLERQKYSRGKLFRDDPFLLAPELGCDDRIAVQASSKVRPAGSEGHGVNRCRVGAIALNLLAMLSLVVAAFTFFAAR